MNITEIEKVKREFEDSERGYNFYKSLFSKKDEIRVIFEYPITSFIMGDTSKALVDRDVALVDSFISECLEVKLLEAKNIYEEKELMYQELLQRLENL